MGYDMYTKEEGEYFRANISGMSLLRGIMRECGVEGSAVSLRECESNPETLEVQKIEGSLFSCFGSNDGWLISPEECRHIAERLEAGGFGPEGTGYRHWDIKDGEFVTVYTEFTGEDRQYAKEFADYCKKAASLGGFYVW